MKKVVDKSGVLGYNNQRCQRESNDNGDPWKRYSEDKTNKNEVRGDREGESLSESEQNSQISERDNGICQASSVKDWT